MAHRIENNFYSKKYSQSCLDRFLIQQQIRYSWFYSVFYKKKVEKFLRLQSLVFLIKRAILSKIYWQLIQSKSPKKIKESGKEDYVCVFDEDKDNFCRQDVLKTIYIFTDLKSRHWHPRASKRQESRLKSQFDQKWNLEEGLRHELVQQYLNLFNPVIYKESNEMEIKADEKNKIKDYLGQIQHKYMKYPNLKLMFQKLIKRSEFFEDDKIVSVFLMIASIMIDLCFDKDQKDIHFADIALLLKEGHLIFKKLKKNNIPELKTLFEEPEQIQAKIEEESPEQKIASKEETEMTEIKQKMMTLMKGIKKKDQKTPIKESNILFGIKFFIYFLEKLRITYNELREKIKYRLITGKVQNGQEKQSETTPIDVIDQIFGSDKIGQKIKLENILKITEDKMRNIKSKHNISKERPLSEALESEMAIENVISWQKLLPRLENYSFSSLFNCTLDSKPKISETLENPNKVFDMIKNITYFFNKKREQKFSQNKKQLKKILSKIKVSARGLLSKDLEKDHSKMLYQIFNKETPDMNNLRLTNLVKQAAPQNQRDMKKYILSIVNGEGGSDYEEESKIQNIFGSESQALQITLDKETQEMVDKLQRREIKLAELIHMNIKKIPNAELRKYEKWRRELPNLSKILEERVRSNKYLEKDFIEGKRVTPAINCLVRKLQNHSLKMKPGTVIQMEFALSKQKKLGQLLTKFMDEAISIEDLFKKFERFYLKFKKKVQKGSIGEKRKKVKTVEPKVKENFLDDICQDIGFVKEPVQEYINIPEPKESNVTTSKHVVGDILKLNIFQSSKIGLHYEDNQGLKSFSTKCEYFFTGDPRVLLVFNGITNYPRLRCNIKKKMSSLINSLEINPFYPQQNSESESIEENQIYGLNESEFREKCVNSRDFLISGWVIISDEVFSHKLNQMIEKGKALGSVLSAHFMFYLGKPDLSKPDIAKELWEKWGVRPTSTSQFNNESFNDINFDQLYVFCLKRKIGLKKNENNLTKEEIQRLKSKFVDKIFQKDSKLSPIKDEIDSQSLIKRSQYSNFCEVHPEDYEPAFNALEQMIRDYKQTSSKQLFIEFPIASTLPLDFQPTSEYLGKRDNDILKAVQEIPDNMLKGLIGEPQSTTNIQEKTTPNLNLVTPQDPYQPHLQIQRDNLSSDPVQKDPIEKDKNELEEKPNSDFTNLLEIVKNVSSSDLKDIYTNLEDIEMKEMLFKAVQKYYPKDNNPLLK
jgi:hypothetical protein